MTDDTPSESGKKPGTGLFRRIYRSLLFLGLLYPVVIAVLAIPPVQKHAVFKHGLRFPLFANFDTPEKYGLAPGKTLNLHISTPDNCTLGAWFVLADPFYQALRTSSPEQLSPLTEDVVRNAISAHPTILFLHGAGATRASVWRVGTYRAFAARLQANVLAIDYRGFGDSTGSPDTDGLALDAHTAWRWLAARGAEPRDVAVVGYSLGTGVAGQLMRRLAAEDVAPRGVALLAPFTTMGKLIETYAILRVPILRPLQMSSWGIQLMKYLVRHEFDTLAAIDGFHAPTLIAHSQADEVIPHAHSQTLIDALLAPLLPTLPTAPAPGADASLAPEEVLALRKRQEEHSAKRGAIVKTTEIPRFGIVEEFKGLRAPVVYVETFWGAHARIGLQEGVQDEMARLFRLGVYRNDRYR